MPENVVPVSSGLSPSAKPISALLSVGAAPAALTPVLAGGEADVFAVNANFSGDGNFASALGQALSTPGLHISAASKGDAAVSSASASDPFTFLQPADVPASAAEKAGPSQQNPLKEANNTAPTELALPKEILPKEIKKQAEGEPALTSAISALPVLLPSPPPSPLPSTLASHASGALPDPSSSNAAAVPPGASVAPPQAVTSRPGNGAGTNLVAFSAIAAEPMGASAIPSSPGESAPPAPLPSGAEGPSSSSSSSSSAPASAPVANPEPAIPHTLGPTSETAPALPTPTPTAVPLGAAAGAANPADAANPQAGAQPPRAGAPTNPVSSSAIRAPSADASARAPAGEAAPASRSASGTDGVLSTSASPASPAKAPAFGAIAQAGPALPGSSATQPAAARQEANSPTLLNQPQATPPSGASVPIFVSPPNPPNSAATASAPTAAPTPAAPATPPTSASPPTPVAQLAEALVSFAAGPNGAQGFTLALSPPELGYLSVHLTQTVHGAITVELAASEPATLRLLLQD
ncbi:MAG: hypothetical protein IRZ25_11880, partial [Methyloceanibacter sp.]|nr:hypothetical protein [Methyloceanibacter sp.]